MKTDKLLRKLLPVRLKAVNPLTSDLDQLMGPLKDLVVNELENEIPGHRSTSQPGGWEQFHRDVFPAELEEINKRRRELQFPDTPPDSAASAKLGLCGLALSGGGIRSDRVWCSMMALSYREAQQPASRPDAGSPRYHFLKC